MMAISFSMGGGGCGFDTMVIYGVQRFLVQQRPLVKNPPVAVTVPVTDGKGTVIICPIGKRKLNIMPKDDLTGDVQWWLDRVDIAGPVVEARAQEADQIHELTKDGMAALHEQGMFRLLLSRKVGGAELPLPVFVQIAEP